MQFVDLPEYFLERYAEEINAWAVNIRKIGLVKSFILKEGRLAERNPNGEAMLIQVKLKCRPLHSGQVALSPLEEFDMQLIRDHVQRMQAAGWPPRLFDKEPERSAVPFTPRIIRPN